MADNSLEPTSDKQSSPDLDPCEDASHNTSTVVEPPVPSTSKEEGIPSNTSHNSATSIASSALQSADVRDVPHVLLNLMWCGTM